MKDLISFSDLKPAIMRRIYGIWFIKKALPWLVLEGAAMYIVLEQLAGRVFVNHVLANAALHTFARSPFALVQYFMQALMNTNVFVQLLIAGSAIFSILLLRELRRVMRFAAMEILPYNFQRVYNVM